MNVRSERVRLVRTTCKRQPVGCEKESIQKSLSAFGLRNWKGTEMEKTAREACLGEKTSSSIGDIRFLSEDVTKAVEYINMEFGGGLQADDINLGNTSR